MKLWLRTIFPAMVGPLGQFSFRSCPTDRLKCRIFFCLILIICEKRIFYQNPFKDEYLDTVSKVYYSYFRSYLQRLMKLKFADTATRNDLIGVIDQPIMSKFSTLSLTKAFSRQTTQLKQKETVFTLGNRKTVIESELEAPVIVPHAERIQEQSHRFLFIFAYS